MRKTKLISMLIGVASAFLLVGCGRTSIDLNDYVEIESDGWDSLGTAKATFDKDLFEQKYGKKIKASAKDIDDLCILPEGMVDECAKNNNYVDAFLAICVKGELDTEDELSNGDVITYSWTIDETVAEEVFHCKLKYEDIEYEVEDLKVPEEFDPFEGVEVTFSGIEPEGEMTITAPDTDMYRDIQYVSQTSRFRNGKEAVVEAQIRDLDYFVNQYGKIPSETYHSYTISGLAQYISSFDELEQEEVEKLVQSGEGVVRDLIAEDLSGKQSISIENMEYCGCYFLDALDEDGGIQNKIYLIYKTDVTLNFLASVNNHRGDFVDIPTTYYEFVAYNDLLRDENGNLLFDSSSYEVPENKLIIETTYVRFSFGKEPTYWELHPTGYESIEDIYSDAVSVNLDRFTAEEKF